MTLVEEIIQSLPVSALFDDEDGVFDFETDEPMDNVSSMTHFLDMYRVPESMIYLNDGTQVTLVHPYHRYKLVLDSMGRGDFFHHRIETEIIFDD